MRIPVHVRKTLRRSATLLLLTACCASTVLAQEGTAAPPRDSLLQVVLVSRHGVRTPLIAPNVLAAWAEQPWPAWADPAGNLTAHGRELSVLLGRYHRASLAAQGLMPSSGCPDPASVYFYADLDQRTEETARGLLEGLAPGCEIPVHSKSSAKLDPLFHPVESKACAVDPLEAQTRILERAHGNLTTMAAQHREALLPVQSALRCCKPDFCAAFSRPATCTLPDLPTELSSSSTASGVGLLGGLQVASDSSELFLLEYANGMPEAEVGWGRIDLPEIRRALGLHDADYDLLYRTPYLSRREASALLARVAEALTGKAVGGLAPPEPAVRNARLVAYVGHDTNIASLGGLLDAAWGIPGSPANPTLPAGALMFERRRSPDGRERVYLSYIVQTLEQMRSASPLTLDAPPVRTPIRIPGCSSSEPGYPCAIDDFSHLALSLIEPTCVAGP
ncbi:MAG TPA: histidine-type phosphatase [Thermoanaerobaculia bacterium]|nr:histidine-type phosphatase [Thermoanaerobaculia bacterium]